jgi:hypothetical protein
MNNLSVINKEQFDKDGFLIFKNLFTSNEIEQLRLDCYKQYEDDFAKGLTYDIKNTNARSVKGDLLSKKHLKKVLLDDRVVNIAKGLLGPDVVYFGDSNFQLGVGHRGYHRDNVDRDFNSGPDWEGEYPIIRFGLYMQDHTKYSGGLKVQRGTHKKPTGESIILDINIGDLVVWNLKTRHSGNAIRLKLLSNLPIDYLEKRVPDFLKKDESKERVACFFTFGLKGKHLDRYVSEYLSKAKAALDNIKNSPLDIETKKELETKGIGIFKPIPEYGE